MSNSCKIFPEVFNKEGELVPSQLFQDLLKSGLDREQAIEKYLETRTLSFMEENGHWLLHRDLNLGKVSAANLYTTDTAAQDAYNKFVEIYGKDYVEEPVTISAFPAQYLIKVKEIARGDIKVSLNELGEPDAEVFTNTGTGTKINSDGLFAHDFFLPNEVEAKTSSQKIIYEIEKYLKKDAWLKDVLQQVKQVDFPVQVVPTFDNLAKKYPQFEGKDFSKAYMFIHNGKTIYIARDLVLDASASYFVQSLVHEIVHGYTLHEYWNNTQFTKEIDELYNHVISIVPKAHKKAIYGLSDPEEFISEIYSDPYFISYIKNLEYHKSQSVFDKFVQIVTRLFKRLLGKSIQNSEVYDKAINLISNLIDRQNLDAANLSYIEDQLDFMADYGTKIQQKGIPAEEKLFKQIVGIKKSEGDANYRAKINKAVDNYNKKFGTAHYVNWSQVGESTLFKIDGVDYRWNGYNPFQGTMFQADTGVSPEAVEALQAIADKLTGVTGIESSLITEAEAKELLGDTYNGEAGFFYENKVYLVKEKASLESAFHEFSHPIINQIYLTNNALFNRLYAELENSEEGRSIIAEVDALYPELGIEAKRKEAITHALGKLSKDAYKDSREAQSLLTKILNAIKQFLNKAFGKSIDVNKLSANMTLAEFSKMLGNPVKKIKLDTALTATTDLQFQKITDVPKLKKIVEESAVVIAKQVAIYSSRLKQGEKSKALDDLRDTLDKIKAVEEVADYFEAMEKALGTIKSSQKALESVAAKNGKFDRTDAMKLKAVEEQLESMAFIADLDQLLQTKDYYKIDLKDEDPFIKLVSDSITQRNHLLSLYRELSLDYLADLLFSQISPTNLEEVKQRKAELLKANPADSRGLMLITSKEDMRNHLQQAPKDIKILNKWLYSTAASNDAALALGALYVKEQLEKAADDTYIAARRMNAALQLYRARKNKLDIDKPREFNEAITETVMDIVYEFDEALGESVPKLHATMTLVNEFDMTKFNMSYLDMKERQKLNPAKKKEIYRDWVMANIELKDNHELIRDSKQRTLSPEAYREWYKDNYFSATKPKFGSEVYQPRRDKYQNEKYLAMDEADREYYDTLKDVLQEHQGKLPESHKQKLKLANWQDATVIPTRYKTLRERALDKDYKGAGKDFIESWATINEEREQKYGLVKLDGEPFFGIPLHHIQRMDINDVSPDIFTNILYFADSVNKRQALQSSEAEMLLLKDVLQDRDVARVTTKGTVIYDNLVESMRRKGFDVPRKIEPIKGGASSEKFSEFIDMIYYGRTELPAGNWLFGKLSINQTVNKLIGAASLTQLAFNVPAGVANKMTGEIMNFSASIGGRFYSPKDYIKAKKVYDFRFIPAVLKDMGKPMPESPEGKLLVLLDPIQGEFKDVKGKKIAQSTFMREFRSDHLFMINNVGEHTMQVSTLLAMMNAKQVTNAKTGEVKSLLDVYKDVNLDTMEIVLEDGYSIDPKEITQLRNRVHRLNQKLHGNYSNTVDMTLLQRRWYGKLALMFRKFVVPGLQRRWDVEHYDYELDQFEAGIYVDAYQYMVNNLIGDLKAFASREASILDSFTTDAERNRYIRQRAGFYQTMFEAAMFITTIILGALVIDEDDDEKDSQAAYMAALFLRRVRGDVSFYFNPLEFINMVKNPTVTSSYVTSIVKFVLGLVSEWGEDAYYDRQVGPFEKGSSKSYARFLKLVPLMRSYINLQSPEEQLKFYNLLSL